MSNDYYKYKRKVCFCVKGKPDVILPLPAEIDPEKEERSVTVDRCIEPAILALWEAGIQTRGCCCGHNIVPPSIIISSESTTDDIRRARGILHHEDPLKREWEILQWNLVDVGGNKNLLEKSFREQEGIINELKRQNRNLRGER